MNVNLDHLEAFISIVKLGSFTRAARLLHVSQPALTVQVHQLEETLGVRLLDRNTRSVQPTQIGKDLAPVVERLLQEIQTVVVSTRELSVKSRGVVRIASLPSISSTILPTAIARFRRDYPGISVKLKDVVSERALAMVKAEEVDFGIGHLDDPDPEIRLTVLFTDRMNVIFPSDCPLGQKRALDLNDLAGFPLILMQPESSVRRLVDRALNSIRRRPEPAYEVTYMSTAVGMVKAGLGVTILPSSALEMGELTGLRSRVIRHPVLIREIGVIEKSGRSPSPAAESFLLSLNGTCRALGL